MVVILTVTMGGAGLLYLAQQQMHAVKAAQHSLRAQIIAETGANAAYSTLKHNFDARKNPAQFPLTSFDGGTYKATVTQVNEDTVQVKSIGTYENSQAAVILDVKNFAEILEGGVVPPTSPWGHGVFCNGYITHNGAGTLKGSVHVNNYLRTNGSLEWGTVSNDCSVTCCGVDGFKGNGGVTIYGTVTAPRIDINGQDQIRTKVITTPAQVAFPANMDLSAYYQIAQANGQVYSSQKLNGSVNWGEIPGGVRWINGTLTQNGSLTYKGCIIATGNIKFNGSVQQIQYQDFPAVVSRDGFLEVNGDHDFTGLVYARGNVKWNGNGNFEGSILCGGNMTFNGAYGILTYKYCQPGALGGSVGGVTKNTVRITAWQH